MVYIIGILFLGWCVFWVAYCKIKFYPKQMTSVETLQEQSGGVVPQNPAAFFVCKAQCVETCPFRNVVPHGGVCAEENPVCAVATDDREGSFAVHEGECAAGVDEDAGMPEINLSVVPTVVSAQVGCDDDQIGETVQNPQEPGGV